MLKINYSFYLEVDVNGKQRPFMALGPIGNAQHLGHLARGAMAKSARIKEVISEISDVLSDKTEEYHFAGDDWCIVKFEKYKSTIINGVFDEFEPFELESDLILKLMEDWYEFLVKWESNGIPGIIYPDKR